MAGIEQRPGARLGRKDKGPIADANATHRTALPERPRGSLFVAGR